ncbi:CBF/Mak21 family-domain-containing protein [Pelagophyceae sp. CCMP2097]|nr:CBF/Mak21 family-domain-containing protein [Pelagophyceae sp. CCMP2097]
MKAQKRSERTEAFAPEPPDAKAFAQAFAALEAASGDDARLAAMHSARRLLSSASPAVLQAALPPMKKKKKASASAPGEDLPLNVYSAKLSAWLGGTPKSAAGPKLQVASLRSLLWLAEKGEGAHGRGLGRFVQAMCQSPNCSFEALAVLKAEALKFDDVRLVCLRSVKSIAANNVVDHASLLDVLMQLAVPTKLAGLQLGGLFEEEVQLAKHHRVASDAWLAALSKPLASTAAHRLDDVLVHVAESVLPHMSQPLRLADFFVSSFSSKRFRSRVLSLHGLYRLVAEHRLEYADFYAHLLTLVTPDLAHLPTEHTKVLYALLQKCLASQHVPEAMLKVFAKRLAHCATQGPPRNAAQALSVVRALLVRSVEVKSLVDDDQQSDGLWELEAFSQHYSPALRVVHEQLKLAAALGKRDAPLDEAPDSAFSYAALYAAASKQSLKPFGRVPTFEEQGAVLQPLFSSKTRKDDGKDDEVDLFTLGPAL